MSSEETKGLLNNAVEKPALPTGFAGHLRDVSIGLVNSILAIPCMIGYAAIIFGNVAFRPFLPMLAKLILFSAMIHQVCFSLFSSLPFAVGQVQDAGLLFLAVIATNIAGRIYTASYSHIDTSVLHHVHPNTVLSTISDDIINYSKDVTSTTIVCIALCTMILGLVLVLVGRAKLTKLVAYLPMSVTAGYLAFIGFFCIQAGLAIATGKSIAVPAQLLQLCNWVDLSLCIPAILCGFQLMYVSRNIQHPSALPFAMVLMPIVFFCIVKLTGNTVEEARQYGWLNEPSASVGPIAVFSLFDFSRVHWSVMVYQIPQWAIMTFVVAFSSCLDVAAIEIDLGKNLNMNKELETVGWSNFFSGLFGGYTGSYIFSQTIFTCRTKSTSRVVGAVIALCELGVFMLTSDVLAEIPRFFFAATLLFIGLDLAYEWLYEAVMLGKIAVHEHIVSLVTFFSMILTNIEIGLFIGILTAIVHFMIRYALLTPITIVPVKNSVLVSETVQTQLDKVNRVKSIQIVRLHGYVFFGTSLTLLDCVKGAVKIAIESVDGTKKVVSLKDMEILSENKAHDAYSTMPHMHYHNSTFDEGMGIGLETPCTEDIQHTRTHPLAITIDTLCLSPGRAVPTQCLILDCDHVVDIDSTALRSCFLLIGHLCRSHHVDVLITGVSAEVTRVMRENKIYDAVDAFISDDLSKDEECASNTTAMVQQFQLPSTLPSIHVPWGSVLLFPNATEAVAWAQARSLLK